MSALTALLDGYRHATVAEREKRTSFQDLIQCYLKNEATYQDFYSDVWTYATWACLQGLDQRDTGIDLVAKTRGTNEYHAVRCAFYAPDVWVQKADLESFFAASGEGAFTRRVVIASTNLWSQRASEALHGQTPPVSKIDLTDLENSQIDWSTYGQGRALALKPPKRLWPHQQRALEQVNIGLHLADRGKMIMACGTGKTLTSLKIAEKLAGRGKGVLFLVPSLSLLSQTLTEWTQESETPLHSFAVCSDRAVGKRRRRDDDDTAQTFRHELRYPATTDAARLAVEMSQRFDSDHMSVVFSTYHSIEVIHRAQQEHALADFDLIVCDEAHRTTGATFDNEDESAFVKVHDAAYLRSAKRLYMTATPRIYGEGAKATAEKGNVTLCSMDDETLYGKQLFALPFSEAVKEGLLVDYKVLVLAVDERHVSRTLQNLLKDDGGPIKVADAAKIIGCWKALGKQGMREGDTVPMRRAVAFCHVIETPRRAKVHRVSSRKISALFPRVVEEYQKTVSVGPNALKCETSHLDGGMNAREREIALAWLKADTSDPTCRILSNVRCLSEGVDVPALDAVLFLAPRKSPMDVVQSLGRVMRKAEGKKRGYVVLPVGIPAGVTPNEALNDGKTYRVVWQVLQALRSHDDRFDAMINKLDLIGSDPAKMEIIVVSDEGTQVHTGDTAQCDPKFDIDGVTTAIQAKVVEKCGNRTHWEDWAQDIAKIANTHILRLATLLETKANTKERNAFSAFARQLRSTWNANITDTEVIEMLAQHLITKPVFEALFSTFDFAQRNPISRALQNLLEILQEHRLDAEADTLQHFYHSVKMRAEGIDSNEAKQKIIVELYDTFFRKAFPRMAERLGIVYTPTEVVDFILHSVNHLLQTEFGQTLGSDGVHILDPFTGTGTFLTRLIQSGLIPPEQLRRKYKDQIYANEIVLLAYYIASINIESTYLDIVGGDYTPFEGICLTDTFLNNTLRPAQTERDIRVVIGNPPYSVGQENENDNNKNSSYPSLDGRIRETYANRSTAKLKNSLYDSYIRAIRWSSDYIGDKGVIGFVTNAGFIETNTSDGLRKCLVEEFSCIYIFHLRGNQRTSGVLSHKEGGKIFGSGSRAPIAITLLVKNPSAQQHGQIFFHDIGDYLNRNDKLEIIRTYSSIVGIYDDEKWQRITPNDHGDWLKQRGKVNTEDIIIGGKKNNEIKLFDNYSCGVKTNRDSWCYNASKTSNGKNISRMINYYNKEVDRFLVEYANSSKKEREISVDNFINSDTTRISWTDNLKYHIIKGNKLHFNESCLVISLYRPFSKQWLYFNRRFNERIYQIPQIFPEPTSENLLICVAGKGSKNNFSALIVDKIPCHDNIEKGQCFPLYLYEDKKLENKIFQGPGHGKTQRRDAITDDGLIHFQTAYPGEIISKEDIFYYVYGLLHSTEYIKYFADALVKELPRIPCVKTIADFRALSQAGRELADLHLHYETVEMYPAQIKGEGRDSDYRVEKMKYGKKGKSKDRTTLIYNEKITITGIPLEAYDYVLNGKPALDWVVERQCVKIDKSSGILNDANAWATETMKNPRYPLELFLRVITVSLQTMKIIRALPSLIAVWPAPP